MTDTRMVTLASLAKVARNAATNFKSCVAFVVTLGNVEDTKDTFIEAYASGILDCKASQVATLRVMASPDAKEPNKYGQRNEAQQKAIRAADVAWVRVRDAAGFKPAKTDGRASNAAKPAAPATIVPDAPVTLQAIALPTVTDAGDALNWLLAFSIKAKTFRNANAKLFDTFGDNGMAIRDALAALTKAIDGAKLLTKKPKAQPEVVAKAA